MKQQFYDIFLHEGNELFGLVCLGVLVVTLLVQLCYYLLVYGRVKPYRNPAPSPEVEEQGLSVIIPLYKSDHGFLDERLPLFLGQKMRKYEVVVVDVTGDVEVSEQLSLMRITQGDRLVTTKLAADPLFPISTKMALNVGIKAARYENILFTLPDCRPRSDRWADVMARGFAGHSIVLGYASIAPRKGVSNALIRCANMAHSVRWLSSAARRKPYRGTLCNLGIKKSLYFGARGFNHLNLNMGEDDLFVMTVANKENTVATMGGSSTIDRMAWGGLEWWLPMRMKLSYPFRFYPLGVRLGTGVELWSRALFFVAVAVVALFLPFYAKIAAGVALLLRLLLVMWQMKRISRRLSEKGLLWAYPLYDFVAPAVEAGLAIRRSMVPKYMWREVK